MFIVLLNIRLEDVADVTTDEAEIDVPFIRSKSTMSIVFEKCCRLKK